MMNHKITGRIYKYRAFVAGLFVVMGLVSAWVDPFEKITEFHLIAGFTIASLGILLRLWGSSYVWVNIASELPQDRTGLITGGPYAYVRNPIYLGSILHILGFTIVLGSPLAVLTMLIPTIYFNYWQAKYEESYFISLRGKEYIKYKQYVPLLIPRLQPGYKEKKGMLNIAQGIKNDIGPLSGFMIILFGVIVLYVKTLAFDLFWISIVFVFHLPGALLISSWVKKSRVLPEG